ncbi:MAG: ribosomal protein S18-alanine N-acetyltransferase [Clostridia bacterium]|nr:ribosomal protein S18-alanine N-acetyltransferase [Clostridia bacterium]
MMTPYEVTLLQAAHLAQVAELERLCFSEPWSERSLAILTQDGGFGVAAITQEGKVIGYGGMVTVLDEGQITNIAVHPSHRRMGIGASVLASLTRESARRGITLLSLEVRASNHAAKELYLGQGFTVAGTRKGFYRHPVEDALVMIKQKI